MKITDTAKKYIEQGMNQFNIFTVRFSVEGPGCCGPKWAFELQEAKEKDIVETINGLNVAIEPELVEVLADIELDFDEDGEQIGFVINGGKEGCCGGHNH